MSLRRLPQGPDHDLESGSQINARAPMGVLIISSNKEHESLHEGANTKSKQSWPQTKDLLESCESNHQPKETGHGSGLLFSSLQML